MDLASELKEAAYLSGSNKSKIEQIINGSWEAEPGLDEDERADLHNLIMEERYSSTLFPQSSQPEGST